MYYYTRDYESALERCDNAIELNPHFPPAYMTLAFVRNNAVSSMNRKRHSNGPSTSPRGALARSGLSPGLLAITDRRRQAFKILHELEALSKDRYVTPFEFAALHYFLGQVDLSVEWLAKAIADRSFELLSIKADPRWESLRTHPRLAPIVAKVGVLAPPADMLFRPSGRAPSPADASPRKKAAGTA